MRCERIRMADGSVAIVCSSAPRRARKTMPGKITWPATRKDLYGAGYKREITIPARACKRCGQQIQFWRTPGGKLMPLEENPENRDELLCHFYTCPHADEFRKEDLKPRPIQKELFPGMFSGHNSVPKK